MNLPDRVYENITTSSEKGNILYDESAFEQAISKWSQALNILAKDGDCAHASPLLFI
ncbi:hypothetical protein PS723_02003 [Pseudomonas fluorescens]|uniref:Tetratricopeptide repeat protein n=1 Tax=Pseudomonas fluorescens TaxID=294 RepID=A0A5E7BWN9_PSEFL|nr:hypothetical protein PS723_02003 [Pseudomonas fluorescens]